MGFFSALKRPFKHTLLGDIASSTSFGATDVLGLSKSDFPTAGKSLRDKQNPIETILDPHGIIQGGTKQVASQAPESTAPFAQKIGPIVGGIIGGLYGGPWGAAGGSAAGSHIGDIWAEGAAGTKTDQKLGALKAALAAGSAYAGGQAGGALGGGSSTGSAYNPTIGSVGTGLGEGVPSTMGSAYNPSLFSSAGYGSGGMLGSSVSPTIGSTMGSAYNPSLIGSTESGIGAQGAGGLTNLQKAQLIQKALTGLKSGRGTQPVVPQAGLMQEPNYDYTPRAELRRQSIPTYAQGRAGIGRIDEEELRRMLLRLRLYGMYA